MSENSKNDVEFRRNMYLLDLILAREARCEKLYIQPKANKTHCHDPNESYAASCHPRDARLEAAHILLCVSSWGLKGNRGEAPEKMSPAFCDLDLASKYCFGQILKAIRL